MEPSDSSRRQRRVLLYGRVSTNDQRPEMQIQELRDLAEHRGWEVVGEYVDRGVSGSRDRRPELDRLMNDVQRGRADIVACWRFDRFARSVRHLVMALDDFRARGVDFVSVNDAIDTSTPAGRFTFHVIAAVAELEREIIRERVKAGLQAAKRRGIKLGRKRVWVDVDRALAMRVEGKSLRKIATALGVGLATLCRALKKAEAGDVPKTSLEPRSQTVESGGSAADQLAA